MKVKEVSFPRSGPGVMVNAGWISKNGRERSRTMYIATPPWASLFQMSSSSETSVIRLSRLPIGLPLAMRTTMPPPNRVVVTSGRSGGKSLTFGR